jgi:hypothetical protein
MMQWATQQTQAASIQGVIKTISASGQDGAHGLDYVGKLQQGKWDEESGD